MCLLCAWKNAADPVVSPCRRQLVFAGQEKCLFIFGFTPAADEAKLMSTLVAHGYDLISVLHPLQHGPR